MSDTLYHNEFVARCSPRGRVFEANSVRVGNLALTAVRKPIDRILVAARSICPDGIVFQVVAFTTEQCEDVLRVLVDDRVVVGFELPRTDTSAPPRDIVSYSVVEYRRHLRGHAAKEFKVAVDFARSELARR